MGWTIGIPSLKLNNVGTKSKHCGNFQSVAEEALSERKGHDPDINPELSKRNKYDGLCSAAELMSYSENHCNTMKDAHNRSLRKDAVRMCVTIIKPPAAYMATLSEDDQHHFLQDGIDKIAEIVDPDNIKSIAWHFDEQGPHVHIFWEPITRDGRLCAKEMHNLAFLGKLNREMPSHLRQRGWDIDDCNAYDSAERALESAKEKSERRHMSGRNSAIYKAAAEQELRSIQEAKDTLRLELEENIQSLIQESIEEVLSDSCNIYEDGLFLLFACSNNRFVQLSEEGESLKKAAFQSAIPQIRQNLTIDELIHKANMRRSELTWQERQKHWEQYRLISTDFWELRKELNDDYRIALNIAYAKKRNALRSYYDAKYLLHRSRGIIPSLIAFIWALIAIKQQYKYEDQIILLKREQSELISNTTSFKKFSNTYKEELKAGKMPFEKYLSSLESIIKCMDQKVQEFQNTYPQIDHSNNNNTSRHIKLEL